MSTVNPQKWTSNKIKLVQTIEDKMYNNTNTKTEIKNLNILTTIQHAAATKAPKTINNLYILDLFSIISPYMSWISYGESMIQTLPYIPLNTFFGRQGETNLNNFPTNTQNHFSGNNFSIFSTNLSNCKLFPFIFSTFFSFVFSHRLTANSFHRNEIDFSGPPTGYSILHNPSSLLNTEIITHQYVMNSIISHYDRFIQEDQKKDKRDENSPQIGAIAAIQNNTKQTQQFLDNSLEIAVTCSDIASKILPFARNPVELFSGLNKEKIVVGIETDQMTTIDKIAKEKMMTANIIFPIQKIIKTGIIQNQHFEKALINLDKQREMLHRMDQIGHNNNHNNNNDSGEVERKIEEDERKVLRSMLNLERFEEVMVGISMDVLVESLIDWE
jgi:cyclophilin family peptidyl-prolyl cis-trans isomerase